MKLFIQDHSWAGATVVVAESPEKAKELMAIQTHRWDCYYDPDKPWDLEKEIGTEPIHFEVFGDR
jgi:hypothetical protein